MSVKVLIFGHSFVSRLQTNISSGNITINMPPHIHVHCAGFSGLTLAAAFNHVDIIARHRPHILILELGTNDLANPSVSPHTLARDMALFAQFLVDTFQIQCVVINQVYFRAAHARRTRSNFNQYLERYHDALRSAVTDLPNVSLNFHRNMQECWQAMLQHDGVHISSHFPLPRSGMVRYFCSIKDAVIKAARKL